MSNYPSLPDSKLSLADFEAFADKHGSTKIGSLLVSRAVVRVPVLTAFNGRGPNAVITGSGQDPELNERVGNKKMHAAALATTVVDRDTGLSLVHLAPDADSHLIGPKGVKLPIHSFGRPISSITDFGLPMEKRDGSEKFSALAASLDFDSDSHILHGQLPDDHLVQISDNQTLGRSDAQRFARPTVIFGTTKGVSQPIGPEGLNPSVQRAVDQTIHAGQKVHA